VYGEKRGRKNKTRVLYLLKRGLGLVGPAKAEQNDEYDWTKKNITGNAVLGMSFSKGEWGGKGLQQKYATVAGPGKKTTITGDLYPRGLGRDDDGRKKKRIARQGPA